jgi:hypothetical protein
MRSFCLLLLLLNAGCATHRKAALQAPVRLDADRIALPAYFPTKVVETRYDIQTYRESTNPEIRHEAHAIYRRTRVSAKVTDDVPTEPPTTYPAINYAPLPPSAELDAELAAQKSITADLRAMQRSTAETEQKIQAQYALILNQSDEIASARKKWTALTRHQRSRQNQRRLP